MLGEFKTFIMKGNVLDLAVAIIIGAAFAKIVASLTDDIIMPIIGSLFGGLDFSSKFITLGAVPATYHGSLTNSAALKAAGVPLLGYGNFISVVIGFVILAFVIFMMVRYANRLMPKPAEVVAGPSETDLLTEIRDELKRRP